MAEAGVGSIEQHFGQVRDPRIERTKRHKLIDLLVIAICAAICGAEDWVAVAAFGRAQEEWLRTFLELPNGVASDDTFRRVFARLDPDELQRGFLSWVQAVFEVSAGQVVPIDGKALRHSYDRQAGRGAIHMVSAWASANHLVLGQVKVDDKSNEITAIPALLRLLHLKGCIVTIDAMGCQTDIATQIRQQEADYVLSLKGNQGTLYDTVQSYFDQAQADGFRQVAHDYDCTTTLDHGRLEIRRCWTISEPEYIAYLNPQGAWSGLRSIAMIQSERHLPHQVSCETRYFISSLPGQAKQMNAAVRTHWSIENSQHWTLDVAFHEDACRLRKGHGAQNFAILRHIALNLLRHDTSAKCGIKNRRLLAAWDHRYLLKLLHPS
jgi:predicted transposase YbfD/YdcC